MVSPEELERVLRDFNFTYETRVAGILTKTGVPMAIQARMDLEEEHFATMAATLVGSTEVLHRGMGLSRPDHILVQSRDGLMFLLNLGKDAFFVAVGGEGCCLGERAEEVAAALRKALKPLEPLKRFVT